MHRKRLYLESVDNVTRAASCVTFRCTSRRHVLAGCHARQYRSFVRKSTVGSILSANRVRLRSRPGLRSCACVRFVVLLSCLQCSHTNPYQIMPGMSPEIILSLVLVAERYCLMGARTFACLPVFVFFSFAYVKRKFVRRAASYSRKQSFKRSTHIESQVFSAPTGDIRT